MRETPEIAALAGSTAVTGLAVSPAQAAARTAASTAHRVRSVPAAPQAHRDGAFTCRAALGRRPGESGGGAALSHGPCRRRSPMRPRERRSGGGAGPRAGLR